MATVFSLFPQTVWNAAPLPESRSHFTTADRVKGIVNDLFDQLPSFAASFVTLAIFAIDKAVLCLIGAGCFLGSGVYLALSHEIQMGSEHLDKEFRGFNQILESCSSLLSRLFSAQFYVMTVAILVHEVGHAVLSLLLFKNPNPRIEIGLGNGRVLFNPQSLNDVGKKIGRVASTALVSFAGPLFGLLHDLILLKIAHSTTDLRGELEGCLKVLLNTLNVTYYALSALWSKGVLGHDFVQLRTLAGIHPVAFAVFFLATPILFKIGLELLEPKSRLLNPLVF